MTLTVSYTIVDNIKDTNSVIIDRLVALKLARD